ncbi:MAG: hypothetical protein WCA07_04995 [Gloeobacterales cyanobacterium]
MKRVLAIGAVGLLGFSLLTPTFAQDAMSEMDSMHHSDNHDNHNESKDKKEKANQLMITPASNLVAGKPQSLTIQVRSAEGKPIEQFDIQHEKLMHLIIVRNDLSYFTHIHPESISKGKLQFTANLPADGQYTAFADYVPKGAQEQVSTQILNVGTGKETTSSPPLTPDVTLSKSVGDLKVSLRLDPKTIKPGQETAVTLDIKDAAGKPVTDLQPYLGAMGHLVMIEQSPVLTAANYLHAHPQDQKGMAATSHSLAQYGQQSSMAIEHSEQSKEATATPGQVTFETVFPKAGIYKLWGQFQRNGKVNTANFVVSI